MNRESEPQPMTVRATEFGKPERNRLLLLAGLAAGLGIPPAILLAHRLGFFELPGPHLEVPSLPKPSAIVTLGDLHVHTAVKSPRHVVKGANFTMEEVFAMAPEKGVTIIALTEESIYDYDTSQQAADEAGIILIPALELITVNQQGWEPFASKIFNSKQMSSVHLLALGVTEPIAVPGEELSIPEAVERTHKQAGLAIIAHPSMAGIDLYGSRGEELIRQLSIDGMEVLNAFIPHCMNEAARRRARELGLPGTGGSDNKYLTGFGRGLTVFTTDSQIKDWQECLALIKQGRISTRGRGTSLASFLLYLLSYYSS